MINCDLPAGGYNTGCFGAVGVLELYIANFIPDTTYTTGTNSVISGFTAGSGGTMSYYTYYQDFGDAELKDEVQISAENGAIGYQPSLSLVMKDLNSILRDQIMALAKAKTSAIIRDRRGRYWLIGKEAGLRISTLSAGTGKGATDLYGASITLMGNESEFMQEIESSAITTFNIT